MAYKLMVIDDSQDKREKLYMEVLSVPEFETLYVWSRSDLIKHKDTPVDGYLIDIFLDRGDWASDNAANLLKTFIQNAPRPAPVFLISQHWGEERVLDVLKQAGESSAKVVQYLAWSEFQQTTMPDNAAKNRLEALRNKISSELNLWHGRSGFCPKPDDTIRILILSDAQFGDPATDPKATFAEHWIAHTLRQNNDLPDLLVIAGDVSHSGRPDQFTLAEERLALDLMGPLWGNNNIDRMRDRIVLVPGNHDVNLRFSACDSYKFDPTVKEFQTESVLLLNKNTNSRYHRHHDYALEPFRYFAHRLTKDRNFVDSPELSWVDRRFLHCGLRFFVLNSVAELSSTRPDHITFSENAMRLINRSLVGDNTNSVFSIAVSHHGLRPDGAENTIKQVNNWESVGRDIFSMNGIGLWIYGHYHEFSTRSINNQPFDKKPLWLIQAPTLRINNSTRGFCVLELSRQGGIICDAHISHYVLENSTSVTRSKRRVFDKG